jgi:hypothetical protein
MQKPVVIVGMGEMGEFFAQAFLKLGYPVYPILRGTALADMARMLPDPELVLLAVGENDLHPVLESMPVPWRDRFALLQNELLPRDWLRHGLADPTVIVVWFDKKKGRPFVPVLPTPVCGAKAGLIVEALRKIEVPCWEIPAEELLYELVKKNLYILVVNLAGIRVGGLVGQLWREHRALTEGIAQEILDIQAWLAQAELPRERLIAGMLEGFAGDPQHICMGRSAPERLRRTLRHAQEAGIAAPVLSEIAAELA